MKTFRYTIKGRVQGVAFRFCTVMEAERLGIRGTVRNLANGDVEVVAQAEATVLQLFEAFLQRGPALARVVECSRVESDENLVFADFTVL